jgi:hypothetical protein
MRLHTVITRRSKMNSAPRFEPDTRVGWHPEQIAAEIDGQVVVMGLSQGKYVGFDAIATNVWHRLERTQSVSELCDGLAADFDGDLTVIRQDVVGLLTRLHELGLIEVETGAPSV